MAGSSSRKKHCRTFTSIVCTTLLALSLAPITVQPSSASVTQDQQTILIWRIGSPHNGDTPRAEIPNELQAEAAKLGYRLEIQTFAAEGFADRFSRARMQNEEPDILAIDNWGLITGIRTNLEVFQGIGSDKKVRESLIDVSLSLAPLVPGGGWQLLITSSKHYSAARAFALREIKCDRSFAAVPSRDTYQQDNDVREISEKAARSFFNNDLETLNNLAGGKYPDDALNLVSTRATVRQVNTCGMWGNQRLALVSTSVLFERGGLIGRKDIVTILSKANSKWQLLHLYEYDLLVRELLSTLPLFLQDGPTLMLQKPMWLTPPEESAFARFPAELRPMFEWTRAGDGKIIYLVETQLKDGRWFQNRFKLISEPGEEATIKLRAPHGVGMQPHRSRIWAIDQSGDIAVSDWRVINYRN